MDINCNYMRQVNYWNLLTNANVKRVWTNEGLVGQKFGRLTIVSNIVFNTTINSDLRCFAQCSCGSKLKQYRLSHLQSSSTQSCGCYRTEMRLINNLKHGFSRERLYRVWRLMIIRCYDEKDHLYKWYGARGIDVYNEWRSSCVAFRSWCLSNGYQDDLEIDRIDNDRGYYPGNIRFVTRQQNVMNRRGCTSKKCSSKFKGVIFDKESGRWRVRISLNKKRISIGRFDTEIEAALAYNEAAIKYHGEYANLNKIDDE